jgi:microcin C transport system substrate-binding protein
MAPFKKLRPVAVGLLTAPEAPAHRAIACNNAGQVGQDGQDESDASTRATYSSDVTGVLAMTVLTNREPSPRKRSLPAVGVFLAALFALSGCSGDSGTTPDPKIDHVEIEFPDGDPSASPDDGGPGFTGEGWTTEAPRSFGDPNAKKGGAITSRIREWPGNLRMAGTAWNTLLNYLVRDLSYQSLLSLDPNTLEFIPQLASHWKISDDQMTFTFRIDPRAHWSDGKPVVAADVVASWKLRMDPTLLDPSAILTYGKLHEPVAKSKYIVEVTAKEKNWRNFLYFSGMGILPSSEIGSITGKDYLNDYNFKYTAVSGPYVVHPSDIVKGKSLTLTRREDFWNKDSKWNQGLYNFDKIRFVVVTDDQLAFEKLAKGELDYMEIRESDWWAKDLLTVRSVEKGWLVRRKIFNDAPNGVRGFALNMRNPPLDDIRVRQALQLLYDRKTLIEKLAYDEEISMHSFYAGSQYENPNNPRSPYDLAKATALLSEAGWSETGPDGVRIKEGKRLKLSLYWYKPTEEKFLSSYKESCAKAGVEIALVRIDPETLWKNLQERKFEMAHIRWGALVFPNPETSLNSELADQNDNNNITGFKSARCDQLFKEYDVAFTQSERVRIIREVDYLATTAYPYVMEWYVPCQRVAYWRKFGIPKFGLHRYSEWETAFGSWWFDPDANRELLQARRAGSAIPPIELHFWDSAQNGDAQSANAPAPSN